MGQGLYRAPSGQKFYNKDWAAKLVLSPSNSVSAGLIPVPGHDCDPTSHLPGTHPPSQNLQVLLLEQWVWWVAGPTQHTESFLEARDTFLVFELLLCGPRS